jgi:transcriptional regulator with XRE-family HTH domain
MKLTQFYRDQLGLSQEFMATYLQITLSQLAMYETGKRDLPSGTVTKLSEISQFLEQKETTNEGLELLEKQKLEVKTFLEAETKTLEFQQIQAQRQLDNILKKYNQNLKLHAFALSLQKSGSSLGEVLLQQATKGIEKYGLVAQTQCILKLEGINSQMVYLDEKK